MANIQGTDDYQEQRGEDMLGAAAILGGASLLGTVYSQERQSDEASFSRKWQKQMSNTAHFRQMADMRRAGLNPILSAGGSGASTPGGAMGNISPMQNPLNEGIQAAQGLASAELTAEQGRIAKVNAEQSELARDMLFKAPGGVGPGLWAANLLAPSPVIRTGIQSALLGKHVKDWLTQGGAGKAKSAINQIWDQITGSSGVSGKDVKTRSDRRDVDPIHYKDIGRPSSGGGHGDRQY